MQQSLERIDNNDNNNNVTVETHVTVMLSMTHESEKGNANVSHDNR